MKFKPGTLVFVNILHEFLIVYTSDKNVIDYVADTDRNIGDRYKITENCFAIFLDELYDTKGNYPTYEGEYFGMFKLLFPSGKTGWIVSWSTEVKLEKVETRCHQMMSYKKS